MVRLLSFILAAFIFSCTIIEDSDITSEKELNNLQFASIDITQQTTSGTATSTARVTSEADVNITVPGGKLTRTVYMDWPALGASSKLKLRGGTTTTFRTYTSFLESGKPWTFTVFSSGSDSTLLELYSFRYNSNGKLASVITRVPYVAGGPATSNDTLIYKPSGELQSVTRRFPGTGTSVVIPNPQYRTSGSAYYLVEFVFQGMYYTVPCQGGGCGSHWGGNYHVAPGNRDNFPSGVMNLSIQSGQTLGIQDFNNINQSFCNGQTCSAWIDTFYLHPLMILHDRIPDGEDFLFLYMIDWWKTPATTTSSNNEKVTFSLNYDL